MNGIGTLFVTGDTVIALQGEGTLFIQPQNGCVLSGEGTLTGDSSYRAGRLDVMLSALALKASDKDFGELNVTLSMLTFFGEETFVPAAQQSLLGWLPALTFHGFMTRSRSGVLEVNLSPMLFKGGDFAYGEVIVDLPALLFSAEQDMTPGVADMRELIYPTDNIVSQYNAVIFISETGTIVDVITASRISIINILESLTATDVVSSVGSFIVNMQNNVVTGFDILSNILDDAGDEITSIDRTRQVWVVNLDTSASWQYDNYGFNSFFEGKIKIS